MGYIFGDAGEKPGNIAAVAVVLAFLMLFAVMFIDPTSDTIPRKEAMTLLGSVITGALGFLFGRSTK